MNREVHVRFWESAGLQCLAPLAYIRAYDTVSDARTSVGRYLEFYRRGRPHSSLDRRTATFEPRQADARSGLLQPAAACSGGVTGRWAPRGAGPAKKAARRLWT